MPTVGVVLFGDPWYNRPRQFYSTEYEVSITHTLALSGNGRAELDELLAAKVDQRDVPGVVAEVTDREGTLYHGAFGKLDERGSVDLPADAIFRIASMTKPVTSVAVMMLKDQGLVDLDDTVGQYLPEFNGAEVIDDFDESDSSYTTRPAAWEITLRHLLSHTAGFGYDFSNYTLSKLRGRSPANALLLHDPGTRWTYGMSTRVLGTVIETVTNESLDVFFESRIFKPLGMSDTGFHLRLEDRPRLAALFKRINGELIGESNPETYEPRVSGDTGLLSTANDYSLFLRTLLGMGEFEGNRMFTEQSIQEMTKNQIGDLVVEMQPGPITARSNPFPLSSREDKFGLGFQLKEGVESGERSRGSYSWAGINNTHFWVDPKNGIAAVLLTQVLPFYDSRCIQLLLDFERCIYRNLE